MTLYSQYTSGNQFPAGVWDTAIGSFLGPSGLNPLVDRLVRNTLPLGSFSTTGSVWVISGATATNATRIRVGNGSMISLLVFNNDTGSNLWIGHSGIDTLTGYELGPSDFYEYLDKEDLYGITNAKVGSLDVRYMEVSIGTIWR